MHTKDGESVSSIPFALKYFCPPPRVLLTSNHLSATSLYFSTGIDCRTLLTSTFARFYMLFEGVVGSLVPTFPLQMITEVPTHRKYGVLVGPAYRALYVRRGANSWTRFSVTLQLPSYPHPHALSHGLRGLVLSQTPRRLGPRSRCLLLCPPPPTPSAPDAWPQPQRRSSSFSHPTCKYYRTSTPAPLSLRAPVVVCLLCRSSQSVFFLLHRAE